MATLDSLAGPLPLAQLPPELAGTASEIADLMALKAAGMPVGEVIVVPPAAEERFYRWNNLPQRLHDLFAAAEGADPDEDDVEEAIPEARQLLREHYFLDEFIDAFYASIAGLGARLRVRRPGEPGEAAAAGRPALMALKQRYQDDWGYDAVWERLRSTGSVALDARPVLVHDGSEGSSPAALAAQAGEVLGAPVRLRLSERGTIVGVERV